MVNAQQKRRQNMPSATDALIEMYEGGLIDPKNSEKKKDNEN